MFIKLSSYLLLLMLLVSCINTAERSQKPVVLHEAISDKAVAFGNPKADTVLIYAQGGPAPELSADELFAIFPWVNLAETLLVSVHQAQTKSPEDFVGQEITFEEAITADSQSVQWLAQTVQHYKDTGKQVYVVGISFGAFVVQELLATQGNIANGYVVVVGRLDMPDEVWQEFAEGRMVGFENGVDIVPFSATQAGMGGDGDFTDMNMAKLAAGLGHKRYTVLLNTLDLSNVVYAFGKVDEQVGRLTQAEIAFLESHNATVLDYEGDHGATVDALTQPAFARLTD